MAAAGAIGSVAAAAISAHGAKKAANRAEGSMNQQQKVQNDDLKFRKKLYKQWKKTYGKLEKQMVREAYTEGPINYGRNMGAINQAFDQAGRNQERSLAQSGMVGSGYQQASNLELARATALADAYDDGLQQRASIRSRLYDASKVMPGQATNLSAGYQNNAAFQGERANTYLNAASGGLQGVTQGINNLGYFLGQMSPIRTQESIPPWNGGGVPTTDYSTPASLRSQGLM